MQIFENSDKKQSNLLNDNILSNILAFLIVLLLLMIISSGLFYIILISIPKDSPALTTLLAGTIITGTIGTLIGSVTFVTNSMNKEANSKIDLAFSESKQLATENQNNAIQLATENQNNANILANQNCQKIERLIADLRFDIAAGNITVKPFNPNKDAVEPVVSKESDKNPAIDNIVLSLSNLVLAIERLKKGG